MLAFRRIVKYGWTNFWRNLWISSATLVIMILALGMMAGLIIGNAITDTFVTSLEEKVDISVYFLTDTGEQEILFVKDTLERLPEVREVRYVSRDEALELFRNRHQDNNR